MAIGLVSKDNRYDSLFLTNYAQINLVNQLGSLPGIGESRLSSAAGLLDARLGGPGQDGEDRVTATDVSNAIQAQNRQNPAGAVGQPPLPREPIISTRWLPRDGWLSLSSSATSCPGAA